MLYAWLGSRAWGLGYTVWGLGFGDLGSTDGAVVQVNLERANALLIARSTFEKLVVGRAEGEGAVILNAKPHTLNAKPI